MNLTAIRGNVVSMRGNLLVMDARQPLIIEVDTTKGNGFNTFTLPLTNHTTNIDVKVSDGQQFNISNYLDINRTVNFATSGVYTLELKGQCGWSFNNTGDCQKLKKIVSWGNFYFNYLVGGFFGCINIGLNGGLPMTGSINAPNVSSLMSIFNTCDLTSISNPDIFKLCTNNRSFFRSFNANKITVLDAPIFDYCILANNFFQTFYNNKISRIEVPIFDKCINALSMADTLAFNDIVYIVEGLFLKTINVTNYASVLRNAFTTGAIMPAVMFDLSELYKVTNWNTSFSAGSIPEQVSGTVQPIWDYASPTATKLNAFTNQTLLTNYNDIPNEWKGI